MKNESSGWFFLCSLNFQSVFNTGLSVDSHDDLLSQLLDMVRGDDTSQDNDATNDITTDTPNLMVIARTETRFGGGTDASI